METLTFMLNNLPAIGQRTIEHVSIVGVAVGLAILTGVPIGIAITQNKRAADIVLYVAAMIMTIPSIALFGLMIPILATIGQGIGYLPAVIAVLLYSQLPIIRNTYTAITNVDPGAARSGSGNGHGADATAEPGRATDRGSGDHGRRAHRSGDQHRHYRNCNLHRRGRAGCVHQSRYLADGPQTINHRGAGGQPARDICGLFSALGPAQTNAEGFAPCPGAHCPSHLTQFIDRERRK